MAKKDQKDQKDHLESILLTDEETGEEKRFFILDLLEVEVEPKETAQYLLLTPSSLEEENIEIIPFILKGDELFPIENEEEYTLV